MKSGIYAIKNIINNKVYIGSAINIDRRWEQHKKLLKKAKHHSKHLQYAWDKDGEQNFKLEVLEEVVNPLHLVSYEQVYLDYYKSYEDDHGYNICKVAGSTYGLKHTEEAKQKIRQASIGRIVKHSEETKQKLREASTDKKHTEEARQKISEASKKRSEEIRKKAIEVNTGRKLSEEHKQKLREASTGKTLSEEARQKIREAKTGKKRSEETKQKLREARIGKKLSEEHRQKMIEAQRNRKDNKYYYFNSHRKKYLVRIYRKFIGWYNTEEEAKQAVIINLEKMKEQTVISQQP
jgi:group I intron endonuclease